MAIQLDTSRLCQVKSDSPLVHIEVEVVEASFDPALSVQERLSGADLRSGWGFHPNHIGPEFAEHPSREQTEIVRHIENQEVGE
jgi:hypothetical protein